MENVVEEVVVENFGLTAKQGRKNFQEQAIARVGEMRINTLGSLMIVDEYNNSQDVWVRFPEGNLVHCTWQQFVNGNVKNVYDRSRFGVGYIGEGFYKVSINGQYTPQYLAWSSMLMRAYSQKFHQKYHSYIGCSVAEEWHNFQTFAAWYDENYYEIDGHRMHLDKDILIKGNKVYSPETCVFVPQFINSLFVKRDAKRGNLPIGVKICTRKPSKYEAQCRDNNGKRKYLGYYDTPQQAFEAYKKFKETLIKDIAKEYKECIPYTLYNAMLTYTVKITD